LEIKKRDNRYGILIVSVTILVLCFVGTASATNWTVDDNGVADFTGIQDAINNAKDGDTIIVHSGVYHENVVVDKSVILKGIDHPVVDAKGSGSAITLTADGITLVGFTTTTSESSWQDAGIKVISNNNNITGNNVRNNEDGISLSESSNNKIYLNNFINNTDNVSYYDASTNIWNSPLEITYTYGGNAYTHYVGNYWGNYKGTDADGDGIGDTSYSIDSDSDERDDYPLMKPFENYVLTTSAPA
jgi:parallel beta-helix repeat protein